MNQRIELLLRIKDVTASKFADMLGVQPSNISHIISGRNKPSLDFVVKVVEAFPDISLEWLIFGKGNMYSQMNAIAAEKEIQELKQEVEKLNKINIDVDLFSELETIENSKIEDQYTEKSIHENYEDLKIEKDEEIFEQENDNEINTIIKEEEKINSENSLKNENIKTEEEKKSEESKVKNERRLETHSEIPFLRKEQPDRIIIIYKDQSFEIIENRNTANN